MKLIILLHFFTTLVSCEKNPFQAGSFVDSEDYTINATIEQFNAAVTVFRTEHPEYYSTNGGTEYTDKTTGRVYYYFDYIDKKRCISTWVRYINSETTFALVSISRENYQTPYLLVNKDIKGSENDAVKREFEERILNPIKEILNRK